MPASTVPILETKRLILRPPTAGDFPAYERLMASPRSRHVGGPYSRSAAWGKFCHGIACWFLFGHGALMIDLRASGDCAGMVDISDGPLFPEKELGWLLYDSHEGRGYATEAAAALRDWAVQSLGCKRLVSYIDPANKASIRVAERLGATLDLAAPKQDPGDLVYQHDLAG